MNANSSGTSESRKQTQGRFRFFCIQRTGCCELVEGKGFVVKLGGKDKIEIIDNPMITMTTTGKHFTALMGRREAFAFQMSPHPMILQPRDGQYRTCKYHRRKHQESWKP
mmetsp:Transcript_20/g.32  ORF Transcript_20/g.32 Transcript_20/m.32 type:complete len:110 (-) Transcript_20:44-373(-)